MKILFVSSWYPSKENPTLGIFVRRHAMAVASQAEVAVIHAVGTSDQTLIRKGAEIKKEGILEIYTYYRKFNTRFFLLRIINFIKYLIAYNRAFNLLEQTFGRPDLVHVNVIFPAGIIGVLIKKIYKIPFIITEHWTGYLPEDGRFKPGIGKRISDYIVRNASGITTVSAHLKKMMISNGLQSKYEVVPNTVDHRSFYPEQIVFPESPVKKFLHVSSLDDDQKNVSGIIRTFKKVSRKTPFVQLRIIGDGGDYKALKELAADLLILDKVVFFEGRKNEKEIAEELRRSDCLILFSNYENQPCVILEALACGVPVISTFVGGIPEVVNHERGILVKPKDPDELYDAIIKMMDRPKGNFGLEYHSYTKFHFSEEEVGKRFVNFYKKVL